MLKIGLLTARGSRHGGGVATVVRSLAVSLKKSGIVEPVVFTLSDDLIEEEREEYEGVELIVCPQIGPRSFGFSASLMSTIAARDIDVLHLHGIWMHTSLVGYRWAQQTGKPYIISPHGMLEPWIRQHGRMKKVLAETIYERRSHERADLVQALTVAEQRDILSFLPTARAQVIPNGVQLDVDVAGKPERAVAAPYVLYLGRLHEKKNLDGLLDGWLKSRDVVRSHNARLVIAGYGEDQYVERLSARVDEINADVPVEFVGSVFGEKKKML
jgi:poly(glycerol-phosphate) alpha-glucosyltransferase